MKRYFLGLFLIDTGTFPAISGSNNHSLSTGILRESSYQEEVKTAFAVAGRLITWF